MNNLLARILDGIVIDMSTPRFNISDACVRHNLRLLDTPPLPPRRLIKTPRLFLKNIKAGKTSGKFEIYEYAFPSRVETTLPQNNTVYGRYYKISDATPKSTVIILHGMFERSQKHQQRYAMNFIKNGHDCLTMSLPYHMERAPKGRQSGKHFVSNDLSVIFEGLKQAMSDIMSLLIWLKSNGEKRIGLMGTDIGGLLAGLVASSTRRVNYLVLLAPAISPLQMTGYTRSGRAVEERIAATGLNKQELFMLFEPWTLIHNKPLVSRDRVLIVKARHDLVVPGDSIDRVWSAWGKPKMVVNNHGHLGMTAGRTTLKDIGAFLDNTFAPKKTTGVSVE